MFYKDRWLRHLRGWTWCPTQWWPEATDRHCTGIGAKAAGWRRFQTTAADWNYGKGWNNSWSSRKVWERIDWRWIMKLMIDDHWWCRCVSFLMCFFWMIGDVLVLAVSFLKVWSLNCRNWDFSYPRPARQRPAGREGMLQETNIATWQSAISNITPAPWPKNSLEP